MTIFLLAFALILFTLFSGYFSASETALFSLSPMKLKSFRLHPSLQKQKVARLVSQPRNLLVTILMMNITVNIFVQNIASNLFSDFPSWTLSVGIPLILTLIFGEIIPKSIAIEHNEPIALSVAPVILSAKRTMYPLMTLIERLANFVSQLLFFFLKQRSEISPEQLQAVIKSSHEQGTLQQEELQLIQGYLSLQQAQVKLHMRHREEILYYNVQDPLEELIKLFADEECTRVPVCDRDFNHMIGVISAKNFLMHRNEIETSNDLTLYLAKPFFVPETASCHKLLQQFSEKEEELALIVDEYGAVSGLITREDLVEEVIGEIADRRDEKKRFTHAGQNVIIASGRMELSEFNELFKTNLQSEHKMVSLGGWLIEQMGSIPANGAHLASHGFLFHVLAADPNRIRRIYVRRVDPEKKDL